MIYALYGIALLLSSSLLFAVQPMVAKMIQPLLGGTPAVWNTAMVFFQTLLLGGYLYAHLTTRWLGPRKQSILHLLILSGGLLFLPIAFAPPDDPSSLASPALWLLLALLISVGWPFFVITSTAPLLQSWFATLEHPRADDPYHLYAASNAGSLLAILAYPFLIEPHLGLQAQSLIWAAGYLLLIASIALCAALLWRSPRRSLPPSPIVGPLTLSRPRRFRWILWAFLPSALLLAITTFITTDLAPVPLLWVPPLALYLLSFILVFARRVFLPRQLWGYLMPPALLGLFTLFLIDSGSLLLLEILFQLAAFFVISMYFHGRLAADRPPPYALTEFYLYLSLGGVLGGIFTALLAPMLFTTLLEYPLLVTAAAISLSPHLTGQRLFQRITTITAVAMMVLLLALHLFNGNTGLSPQIGFSLLALLVLLSTNYLRPRQLRGAFAFLGLLLSLSIYLPGPEILDRRRSFFAAHQVQTDSSGHFHLLYHGTTNHGVQSQLIGFRDWPLAYYYPTGPLDDIFELLHRRPHPGPVAVVGLGTGSMAAYSRERLQIDFFEIDRAVIEIASDPTLFTYLQSCGDLCRIIVGDGRLQLSAIDDHRYDLIVLDAYTSSAIPVHLLTREALELYLRKLRPDGLLAIHISNRYLDLEPPLTRAAHHLGLISRFRHDHVGEDHEYYDLYAHSSTWMVMARHADPLQELAIDPIWESPPPRENLRLWTDDFADILSTYGFD